MLHWCKVCFRMRILLLVTLFGCQGFQLNYEFESLPSGNNRTPCGILTCVEYIHSSANTHNESNSDLSTADKARKKLSSMTFYMKDVQTQHAVLDDVKELGNVVATITSTQPRMLRVSDGITVDGQLTDKNASLQIELFKQTDCVSVFTCRVVLQDHLGKKVVREMRVIPEHSYSARKDTESDNSPLISDVTSPKDESHGQVGWEPYVAMHILSLVENLNVKLTEISSYQMRQNDHLKDDISNRIKNLENKIECKINDLITSTVKDTTHRRCEELTYVGATVEDLKNQLDDFSQQLENMTKSLEVNYGYVATNSTSSNENQNLEGKCLDFLVFNEQQLLRVEDDIAISFDNMTTQLNGHLSKELSSLEEKVQSSLEDKSSNMLATFNAGTSTILNTISPITAFVSTVESTIDPATCEKDLIPIYLLNLLPYLVIDPGPKNVVQIPHLCDTHTDSGGWIVLQRRVSGNILFYRGWEEYKNGFGSFGDDFWLGLENIHNITQSGEYELRIDLRFGGKSAYAIYDSFSLGNEEEKFALHIGSYRGTAGDSLRSHDGKAFSTYDRDNDEHSINCAERYQGAFWYHNCHDSNLNGMWNAGHNKGLRWNSFSGENSVSYSEMKIRKV